MMRVGRLLLVALLLLVVVVVVVLMVVVVVVLCAWDLPPPPTPTAVGLDAHLLTPIPYHVRPPFVFVFVCPGWTRRSPPDVCAGSTATAA